VSARVIGEATPERIETVRRATAVVEGILKGTKAFQYLAILHEDRVTGMVEGRRAFGSQIEVRCWDSVDARTATPTRLGFADLERLAAEIVRGVPGVVSVTYGITPKPHRGSSILISGTSGTGKSSLAVCFADSVCAHGEKCLYLSFEESAEQLKRNMASIGFDLGRWESSGLLRFHCVRPTIYGLETHLGNIHRLLEDFSPAAVVMDPVTSLMSGGPTEEVKAMLTRLIDFIKNANITALFTCLVEGGGEPENSGVGISSLMDTWILLTMIQSAGERNRLLYLLKSRGMAHSNQVREFVLSSRGIEVTDIYVGPGTVLTGSARVQQEARDRIAAIGQERGFRLRQRELTQQRVELKAQLETLKLRLETVNRELEIGTLGESERLEQLSRERQMLVEAREADPSPKAKP
jgi:circadian clock protein KaiC